MNKYVIRKDEQGNDQLFMIEKNGKKWSVPMVDGNSDYQRYLNPEATQSTPSVTNGDQLQRLPGI